MAAPQWLQEKQAQLKAEQAGLSSADIETALKNKKGDDNKPVYEHVFNPDTVTPQVHNWVDRGLKLSCEGAHHPWHETWKRH